MCVTHGIRSLLRVWLLAGVLAAGPGHAQQQIAGEGGVQAAWSRILGRDTLTGDWLGFRTLCASHGVEIFGGYSVEVWGNTSGGQQTGAVSTGLLDFGATVDLDQAVGWQGASLRTSWLWISGRDPSADLVANFLTVSNIAGFDTLRMFELWFQQNFWDDRLSLRIGQLAADQEFVISENAGIFINSTFGWPPFLYMNLPAGGPAYPMATPGVRLELNLWSNITFRSGIYQGNVYAENINRHGFRWRLDGENGFLFLNELEVRWNQTDSAFPGRAKTGVWMQTGQLADVLAESTDSGNYGWYFVFDQTLHREAPLLSGKGDTSADASCTAAQPATNAEGLGFFTRMAVAPGDRNFVAFYADTGLAYTGLLPGRDEDVAGIGFAFARVGETARGQLAAAGSVGVGAEMVLELTYQAQLTQWLSIQPDLQYIIQPSGTRDSGNAWVVGGRMSVVF